MIGLEQRFSVGIPLEFKGAFSYIAFRICATYGTFNKFIRFFESMEGYYFEVENLHVVYYGFYFKHLQCLNVDII